MSAALARTLAPLLALNFFMADIQAGIGPFLGVFLQHHGWQAGAIGTVMTLGGVAGVAMTTPAGIWIDSTSQKRLCVALACACSVVASGVLLLSQQSWVVLTSQIATAIAGAAIVPAVAGITLGIVHQSGFNHQNGRNQAFNHAGNAVGAALSGLFGWLYGFAAVFWLAAGFGFFAIMSVAMLPESAIDHQAARGSVRGDANPAVKGLAVLFECRPLLVLSIALALFHLGNAAMLPLYGMAGAAKGQSDPAAFVAITIVVAQVVMVAASLVAIRMADAQGHWFVMLVSFIALPLRGLIAWGAINDWGVYPVQILDGIGAGLQSVAVPGMVVRIMEGTGRVNAAQGAVMTAQGVGAALSPMLGGWLAEWLGYNVAFLLLGSFALLSLALWLAEAATLKPAPSGQAMAA